MSYTYDPYWQQRIADTFNCALNAYTRVLALRVDLRLSDTPAATDAAVISRFIDALKARINAYFKRHQREGKRVWPTTLRFVWAREFGEIKGKKHYHVLVLLNRNTWCWLGDYKDPETLAGMIKQAWCSEHYQGVKSSPRCLTGIYSIEEANLQMNYGCGTTCRVA
ncbi:hypothetical protein C3709_22310 [Lelliottia aquatilis]|uniref:YagK/YfjJ C-terminal domain-containing protein n=1 Tax=Lelliottia aquatilis TaxID=2080838 RepID=A0ABX4ZVC8_9ENTR|nr:hypothetical protein C3Z09_21445 [Lelliottia aquatilis]POZ15198.1 hypothetical protein C3708_22430 [Lelliottia sp. 7254-16]POZ18937.1 hypothetical protein C3712_22275 [Lelliottia aquatilis]POZ20505.1 hypothetical protein C3711_22480 [Lelliottia aquatilis]POZ30570.1 hypothetical protein C3710_22185 [Lelliottia aquatilis]